MNMKFNEEIEQDNKLNSNFQYYYQVFTSQNKCPRQILYQLNMKAIMIKQINKCLKLIKTVNLSQQYRKIQLIQDKKKDQKIQIVALNQQNAFNNTFKSLLSSTHLPPGQFNNQSTSNANNQQNLSQQLINSCTQNNVEIKQLSSNKKSKIDISKIHGYYIFRLKKAFENRDQDDYFSNLYEDHFFHIYQGIQFTKFLTTDDEKELKFKKIFIEKKQTYKSFQSLLNLFQEKITIIFDLDETLIHCNESLDLPSDVILDIKDSISQISTKVIRFCHENCKVGINIRPYATELLKSLANNFEIIVFTASQRFYANTILDYLDPMKDLISHRIFIDNCCMTTGGILTKDLRIFENRPLNKIVIVDNSIYSFIWQIDNGIPIIPYYDNKNDKELYDLENYLNEMLKCKDVMEFNRNNLLLHYFRENSPPQQLYEKLFGNQTT